MKNSLVSNLSPKMKILSILARLLTNKKLNFPRSVLFHGKTRVCVKYFDHNWGCAPCIYLCLINLTAIHYFFDTSSLEQVRKDCVVTTGFGLAYSWKCLKILWYSLLSCNICMKGSLDLTKVCHDKPGAVMGFSLSV